MLETANPAGSSNLVAAFAGTAPAWPDGRLSPCMRGVAGWQENLGTSGSKRRKAQVLKR